MNQFSVILVFWSVTTMGDFSFLTTNVQEKLLFYPTGSGKTRIACTHVLQLYNVGCINLVIIIVPNYRLKSIWTTELERCNMQCRVVIATYYTYVRDAEFYSIYRDAPPKTIFILDEVHNVIPRSGDGTDTQRRKVETFYKMKNAIGNHRNRFVICLSATPFSSDVIHEALLLAKLLGYTGKSCDALYSWYSERTVLPDDSVFDGYSARIDFITNQDTVRVDTLTRYWDTDIDIPLFLIGNKDVIDVTLRHIHAAGNKSKHFVVFYSLDMQATFAKLCEKVTRTMCCTSADTDKQVNAKLAQFNSWSSGVLVVTYFYAEGFTVRNVTHIHITEPFPTFTPQQTLQIMGRVCRYGSHDTPDTIVYGYVYADADTQKRVKVAMDREREARQFLVDVMDLAPARSSEWINSHAARVEPKIPSTVLTGRTPAGVALFNANSLHDLIVTSVQDDKKALSLHNGCMFRVGTTLHDTSSVKILSPVKKSSLSFNEKQKRMAQFIVSHNGKVIISGHPKRGTRQETLSRHEITPKIRALASSFVRDNDVNIGRQVIKGAKLRQYQTDKLREILCDVCDGNPQVCENIPSVLRLAIYHSAQRYGCYIDMDQ